jgi:CRP-like cAMP-binding protein
MTRLWDAAATFAPLLEPFCTKAKFGAGDVIRRKGNFYKDMYLIVEGLVDVHLEANGAHTIEQGPGSPIGEIGYLRGCRATATVVARTPASAVVIDDGTLRKIQESDRKLAVDFCRFLATTSEERVGYNASIPALRRNTDVGPPVDVLLCRDPAMLREAAKLRYSVYCTELGRSSPHADHVEKTISDHLDDFGHTFIAISSGEAVGTLRANLAREGSLGILTDLYGMNLSKYHPEQTAICTKFAIKQSKRLGYTSIQLVSVVVQYGMRSDVVECYIDCIPSLVPLYEKFGFALAGDQFFHHENGPSYPMKLDLVAHGQSLCERVATLVNRI